MDMELFMKYFPAWFLLGTVIVGWGGAVLISWVSTKINTKWKDKIVNDKIDLMQNRCTKHIAECDLERDGEDKRRDKNARKICQKIEDLRLTFNSYKDGLVRKREIYIKEITQIKVTVENINIRLDKHDEQNEARQSELVGMQNFNSNIDKILNKIK